MLTGARWLAFVALLIASNATAETVSPECFISRRTGVWVSDCSTQAEMTYCYLKTGDARLGFEITTRTSSIISPPEVRLVFTSDALALRPGARTNVQFRLSKESPESGDGKASSPTSVAVPMNIVSLAFWVTSNTDPDTMTFTIEGKDRVLTFPHRDFSAALDRMLDCIDGK